MWWLLIAVPVCAFAVILIWPHHLGVRWRGDVIFFFWRSYPFLVTKRKGKYIVKIWGKRVRRRSDKLNTQKTETPGSSEGTSKRVVGAKTSQAQVKSSKVNSSAVPEIRENKTIEVESDESQIAESCSQQKDYVSEGGEKIIFKGETVEKTSQQEFSKLKEKSKKQTDDDASQESRTKDRKSSSIDQIRIFYHRIKSVWKRERSFILSNKKWLGRSLVLTWKILKPISFQVEMSGGFEDPSETGMLYGITESLSSDSRGGIHSFVSFTPCFAGSEPFKSRGNLFWRTSIGAFLLWLFLLIVTYPWIGGYLCWHRNRKQKETSTS